MDAETDVHNNGTTQPLCRLFALQKQIPNAVTERRKSTALWASAGLHVDEPAGLQFLEAKSNGVAPQSYSGCSVEPSFKLGQADFPWS